MSKTLVAYFSASGVTARLAKMLPGKKMSGNASVSELTAWVKGLGL